MINDDWTNLFSLSPVDNMHRQILCREEIYQRFVAVRVRQYIEWIMVAYAMCIRMVGVATFTTRDLGRRGELFHLIESNRCEDDEIVIWHGMQVSLGKYAPKRNHK